jgi:hypothetical protein
MTEYLVTWQIDIEAEDVVAAAEEALRIQRKPDSIATVFEIKNKNMQRWYTVDLNPELGDNPQVQYTAKEG